MFDISFIQNNSKGEMTIENEELLEEYVNSAPTEVYLSPRESLSESWSSTTFLSHTEKLGKYLSCFIYLKCISFFFFQG